MNKQVDIICVLKASGLDMIISNISYDDKDIELCGNNHNSEENVYTLLVGRNGCGKSTLLKKICLLKLTSELCDRTDSFNIGHLSRHFDRNANNNLDNTGSMTYQSDNLEHTITIQQPNFDITLYDFGDIPPLHREAAEHSLREHHKTQGKLIHHTTDITEDSTPYTTHKLIAVSSSPFDKFPIPDNFFANGESGNPLKHYIYRGARTNERTSQKNYLTSKFDQLGGSFINLFLTHESKKNEILPLFTYLGLASKLKLVLKTNFHFSFEDFLNENGRGPIEAIRSARFFKGGSAQRNEEPSIEARERIVQSVRTIHDHYNKNQDAHFGRNSIYELNLDITSDVKVEFIQEFATLAEYDLIDLENIEFTKANSNSSFLLTDASSGELCILFNILSIAGAITDNSVILLDEPELSLHPEWQRDFLPLAQRIFSNYKRCHFIIATHSPQIVSSMSATNSYVVNLEKNPAKVIEGRQTTSQSSDYQLAYVFNAPGHKNEYLITQIVETLTQIRDGRKPDETFLSEIEDLIKFYNVVPINDPVKKLLSTLKKALRIIAND